MHSLARKLTIIVCLMAVCSGALAAVTKATLAASPVSFSGNCPKKFVFSGTITVDKPGTVTYEFIRSDGAKDTQPKTLTFTAAGTKNVADDTWTLGGASLPTATGWEAIKVTAPNAFESNHANFKLACDPPLNSVKAAHGNTDWHIDTANEFLFGTNMSGTSTAANFAPSGWTKTHIHTGLTNTAHFYNDKSVTTPADDSDTTSGIDKPMLFFYAGHGGPGSWSALGNSGQQKNMLLGNLNGSGQLRYYWQCSCEVFAHGPHVSDGTNSDYSDPGGFDGSSDSADMRNVFQRWGPAIGPDLRMACGMSTLAYCHTYEVNRVWNDYNNNGLSVVDSFMDGFGLDGAVVPLCITRGGSNINATPLFTDDTFTNQRNTSGESHLHIVYPSGTQTDPPVFHWNPNLVPKLVKLILFDPMPDPPEFRRKLVVERNVETLRDDAFAGGAATVRRSKESGAVYLKAAAPARAAAQGTLVSEDARRRAVDVARNLGWLNDDKDVQVQVRTLRTASMVADGKSKDITRGEKGSIVTISRRFRANDVVLDNLGLGGRIQIELAPTGEVLRAARAWRQARVQDGDVAVKPYGQALEEALRQLVNAEGYTLRGFRFGYKEAAGNVLQRRLRVAYEFDFVPKDFKRLTELPPQRIEVAGEAKQ